MNIDAFKNRFQFYKSLGDKTIGRLSEEQIFWQYNQESNSVAVLIKHIAGNMLSRFTNFLTEDGEKSWRNRDAEFINDFNSKDAVIQCWEKGWDCLWAALDTLTEEDLDKEIVIRGESMPVFDALLRQLAHYPYHIGQIIFLSKMMLNDHWESLSIPKNKSEEYNKKLMGFSENKMQENSSPVCFAKSEEIREEYRLGG